MSDSKPLKSSTTYQDERNAPTRLSEMGQAKIKGALDALGVKHKNAKWDKVELPAPEHLTCLNWMSEAYAGQMTFDMDVVSPYVQVTTQTKSHAHTLIDDYCRYQEIGIPDLDCVSIIYGVSMKQKVTVTSVDSKAKVTSLPLIAASSSFGMCSATISLSVRGISKLNMPDEFFSMELNVDTWPRFVEARAKLMKQIDASDDSDASKTTDTASKKGAIIWDNYEPQILFVRVKPKWDDHDDKLREAVNITYALGCVAAGKTKNKAKEKMDSDHLTKAIDYVYTHLGVGEDSDTKSDAAKPTPEPDTIAPTALQKVRAKTFLHSLHIGKDWIGRHTAEIEY